MGWRKERKPKQSISSATSLSFLTEQNLTFHRFSDATLCNDGKLNDTHENEKPQVWTTSACLDFSAKEPNNSQSKGDSANSEVLTPVTESADNDEVSKRYSAYSACNSTTSNAVNNSQHGSTMKLIQVSKDDIDSSSKQSRCSIFKGTILCLCMNMTYANIVRFPRELERHGTAFLVPYLTLMFLVGIPIVLLEICLGQFLGQGSGNVWKASPLFKGASIVGRFGSWLTCLWISMQMSIVISYIGHLSYFPVPFLQCPSRVQKNEITLSYEEIPTSGQKCLQSTFLQSVSDSSLRFGMLAVGLIFFWVVIMLCSTSTRVNRRSVILFGVSACGLFLFELGWQIANTIQHQFFPHIWSFDYEVITQSSTWFYALIQVIFSTNIGTGAISVVTGKSLNKGDAVKMCTAYMSFNFLITIISTAYYLTTFGIHNSSYRPMPFPELSTITSIYDRAFVEPQRSYLRNLIPGLAYGAVLLAGIISVSLSIYTSSRLFKRHPNYVMCLAAMFVSITLALYPNFVLARFLDMRWSGIIIVCALVVDIIAITWIYGIKDLSIDLEFSIGRRISKLWLILWTCTPLFLIAIISCFIAFPTEYPIIDPIKDFIPKWAPIVLCVLIVLFVASHETRKQVDYNICDMIGGAAKPAKDWGPADPIVRHAWKQWKSVCDDTGQRDFTLRRRGTKDWTSSIKKGQYTHASRHKYTINGKNNSGRASTITAGSNSPNYSGSMFGDSAIEEDIGCSPNQFEGGYETQSRRSSNNRQKSDNKGESLNVPASNFHKVPIRVGNGVNYDEEVTSVEVIPPLMPPLEFHDQSSFLTTKQNPLCLIHNLQASNDKYDEYPYDFQTQTRGYLINNIQIGESTNRVNNINDDMWMRMHKRNDNEFSTEL